jgi:hypothetical protein
LPGWQIALIVGVLAFVGLATVGFIAAVASNVGQVSRTETLASDDGRCRATVSRGWVKRPTEGKADELALLDATHELFVRIIPEPKLKDYDLASYGSLTRDSIKSRWAAKYDDVEVGPPSDTTCAGVPAKRAEGRMTHTGTMLSADHYVFETPKQFVQVVVVGPRDRSRWQGAGLDALLASVTITDSPAAAAASASPR